MCVEIFDDSKLDLYSDTHSNFDNHLFATFENLSLWLPAVSKKSNLFDFKKIKISSCARSPLALTRCTAHQSEQYFERELQSWKNTLNHFILTNHITR